MTKSIPIRHNLIWANLYIVVGVFCTLFFLIASLILNHYDIVMYALAAVGPVFIGIKMRKSNYALVSIKRIQVFGLLGQLRKDYQLDNDSVFVLKSNRIYLKKGSKLKKISINNWFVNQYDWKRAIDIFDKNESEKLTKHLIDD